MWIRALFSVTILLLCCLTILPAAADTSGLSLRLAVYKPAKGPIRMVLRVENTSGHEVVISQPSGQVYEFAVFHEGREVWRWSQGNYFLQAVTQKVFPSGAIEAFSEDWNRLDNLGHHLPGGAYTVRAFLPLTDGQALEAESRTIKLP